MICIALALTRNHLRWMDGMDGMDGMDACTNLIYLSIYLLLAVYLFIYLSISIACLLVAVWLF